MAGTQQRRALNATNRSGSAWYASVVASCAVLLTACTAESQQTPSLGAATAAQAAEDVGTAPATAGVSQDAAAVVPYAPSQWTEASAAGALIAPGLTAHEQARALSAYGFILRHAPAAFFEDFQRRAYFASVLDCTALRAESADEFSRRDAVERRFAALRAAVAQVPAPPITVSGWISVREYDFTKGAFALGQPVLTDGFPLEQVTFPGRLYGLGDRSDATVRLKELPFQRCAAVPARRDPFGNAIERFDFPVRMVPFNFGTPSALAMDEDTARSFSRELSAERRLVFTASFQGKPGGVRASGMPDERNFPGPMSFTGPFIDLDLLDWRITGASGRLIASMSDNEP